MHEHEHHEHHHHHNIVSGSPEELKALLEYMLHHNISHAEDISQIAEQLKAGGNTDAGEKALSALEKYNQGNALLKEALESMK